MPTPTIESLGLPAWLNVSAPMHNGKDYARFEYLVNLSWTPAAIGKEFGVTERTIINWKNILKKEPLNELDT
jgi:hypothetical protein